MDSVLLPALGSKQPLARLPHQLGVALEAQRLMQRMLHRRGVDLARLGRHQSLVLHLLELQRVLDLAIHRRLPLPQQPQGLQWEAALVHLLAVQGVAFMP
ncbi:MAG: hypothetical protein AAGJ35_05845 [Myxococcota bacterium]